MLAVNGNRRRPAEDRSATPDHNPMLTRHYTLHFATPAFRRASGTGGGPRPRRYGPPIGPFGPCFSDVIDPPR